MVVTDLSQNSSARIRLSNLVGYSEPSSLRTIETIEFLELPKPDIHIVTIIAILISAILFCVIIVISLKRFGSGGNLATSKDEKNNFGDSFDNPVLEPSSSSNEDGDLGDGAVESDHGDIATSSGMIRMTLKSSADRLSIKSDDSEPVHQAQNVRKNAANRNEFFVKKSKSSAHTNTDSKIFHNIVSLV